MLFLAIFRALDFVLEFFLGLVFNLISVKESELRVSDDDNALVPLEHTKEVISFRAELLDIPIKHNLD